MPEYIYNDGLCSTCKFSSQCMFRKENSESVYFCEEYEQAEASQNTGRARAPGGHIGNNPGNYARKPILGLCSNCIHRETCSFPKPESGVWHCEEYQ